MIKVMIVDDHTMFREGLCQQFNACADIKLVGEADSAATLLPQLARAMPDVIILDIKLPDGNGTSLIAKINAALPRCKIVILTMYDHVRYALHALEQGANGFVLKGAPFEELIAAVRDTAAGKQFVCRETSRKLAIQVQNGNHNFTPLDILSKREFEVLTHLGRGFSAKEIANILKLSAKTISTYKQRLMLKLKLNSQAELIRFAIDIGLE